VDTLRFSSEADERGRRYRFTGRIALDRAANRAALRA